jgi:hypothetical protein
MDKPSKGLKLELNNVLQIYGHLFMCDSLTLKACHHQKGMHHYKKYVCFINSIH